jgi:hypothetical protein
MILYAHCKRIQIDSVVYMYKDDPCTFNPEIVDDSVPFISFMDQDVFREFTGIPISVGMLVKFEMSRTHTIEAKFVKEL